MTTGKRTARACRCVQPFAWAALVSYRDQRL